MACEVLSQRCVELRCLLKGHAVPRIVETQHVGVGNTRGEPVGLGGANQDVFAGADQKRGRFDLRETRLRRVAPNRMELAEDSSKGGWTVQSYAQMRAHPFGADRIEELRRIEQAWERPHPNLGAPE